MPVPKPNLLGLISERNVVAQQIATFSFLGKCNNNEVYA